MSDYPLSPNQQKMVEDFNRRVNHVLVEERKPQLQHHQTSVLQNWVMQLPLRDWGMGKLGQVTFESSPVTGTGELIGGGGSSERVD